MVDVLGMTIILPLLPFYAEHLGASPFVVGLLVSSYAACQLVAGPLLGSLSDRTGRRPLLLVSQVGTLIGFLILAYAGTLWMVFLSRIIDGITAGNLSLAQAYIADVTKPEDRAKSFGVIGIAFGIGFLIGPALSGFLSQFGYQYPAFAAAALSFTSIVATYFLLPEARPQGPRESWRGRAIVDWRAMLLYFRRPGLNSLLWQFFAFVFAFSAFMSGFPLFAERRFTWEGHPFGPREVGYVYAFFGLLGIIVQGGLLGRLVRRFGEVRLVKFGFLSSAVSIAVLGFTGSIPLMVLTTSMASVGTGILRPAITSLITRQAGKGEQGSVIGLTQSLMSVANIVAPLLAGLLIEHHWLAAWALTGAAVMLAGNAAASWGGRHSAASPAAATALTGGTDRSDAGRFG
jgi:MFS transporter, DHA1 family, tetracycline resistance protein